MKKIAGTLFIAIVGGLIAVAVFAVFNRDEQKVIIAKEEAKVRYANFPPEIADNNVDLTYAAGLTVHAVVHVTTKSLRNQYSGNPLLDFFFGPQVNPNPEPVLGFGSGVIISDNGYIVTNNHVIDNSDEINVILNDKRTYSAEIVGTDPSTDIALLKINEKDLSYIKWGDSDKLKIGEWVLAVGNPYNLTSTVTAGIVSAKARNINIIQERAGNVAIESFIQTDAAVNPGNSGGALVNTRGELVGINTAIASRTGAYTGYSFAVPVNIVKKVVKDLKDFGEVQRAILGVTIQDVNADLAEDKGIKIIEGVYVSGIRDNSAAKDAGIKTGDIIIEINGIKVNNTSELQEQVSRYRPNDVISVVIKRDNKKKQFSVTLRNMQGSTEIVKKSDLSEVLGATFRELTDNEKDRLRINYGVKIIGISEGKFKRAGIKEDFIVTRINNKPVDSVNELKRLIEGTTGGVYIEGIYPNGVIAYYAFGI